MSGDQPLSPAIARLIMAGWWFTPNDATHSHSLPLHGGLANELSAWVHSFGRLASGDDRTWFLAARDYEAPASDDAFAWNEFERLSFDSSEDEQQAAAVTGFWRRHLPILLSVRDGYEYLAVREDGVIVYGGEPEFEDAEIVASSLAEMLDEIARRSGAKSPGATRVEKLLGL